MSNVLSALEPPPITQPTSMPMELEASTDTLATDLPFDKPNHELTEIARNVIALAGPDQPAVIPPTAGRLALGSLGFATLFSTAALSVPIIAAPWVCTAGLAAALGTALLTGPALLILHQFLGLHARPIDLVHALSRGYADAGQIALGLSPFVLMLSLTSRLALPVVVLCCAGLALLMLAQTFRRLFQLEHNATDAGLREQLLMLVLVTAWSAMALLISARIAFAFLLPALSALAL
ncbi:MAG: hypothetical protein ACI9MC_003380 [Kiritimatiellia bacterium]|jgi:hypothetical protein